MKLTELDQHLSDNFGTVSLKTTGFGCVAVPEKFPKLRTAMSHVDSALDRVLPKDFRYLAFGHAVK